MLHFKMTVWYFTNHIHQSVNQPEADQEAVPYEHILQPPRYIHTRHFRQFRDYLQSCISLGQHFHHVVASLPCETRWWMLLPSEDSRRDYGWRSQGIAARVLWRQAWAGWIWSSEMFLPSLGAAIYGQMAMAYLYLGKDLAMGASLSQSSSSPERRKW